MTKDEALKMCLEYIETNAQGSKFAILIKEALAQPEQEPVAWPCLIAESDFSTDTVTLVMQCTDYKVSAGKHWLSTTPPPVAEPHKRPSRSDIKPLTDEEVNEFFQGMEPNNGFWLSFARAIEAAHGIKENT